jgi:hypothetical protein
MLIFNEAAFHDVRQLVHELNGDLTPAHHLAQSQSGQEYFLSLLSDFATDPQWRPEWIDPKFLVADVCGRAISSFLKISEDKAPASWRSRIDTLRSSIHENHQDLLALFPAVMEGARRTNKPVLSEMGGLIEPYQKLISEPSIGNLLILTPAIIAFGVPPEAYESLHMVVANIRRDSSQGDDEVVLNALKLLAHIATMLQNVKLADAVAEACIERLALNEQRQTLVETIYRLVECAGADQNRDNATASLARRLEQVSYIVRNEELLAEIAELLQSLKLINTSLETKLGRAIAMAKLGRSPPLLSVA